PRTPAQANKRRACDAPQSAAQQIREFDQEKGLTNGWAAEAEAIACASCGGNRGPKKQTTPQGPALRDSRRSLRRRPL
ncbi:hypothetical protein, partial [Marinovum algicola]|uniref:hypothetical protein n=1 Tax=Marinovum algicola TaxID=42444 RepID=UPI0032EB8B64